MTYLVRKERLDHTAVDRFLAMDMASAERKCQEYLPGVKLSAGKHFRIGTQENFQVTVLSQA
jgi:hypothetical protein